MVLNDLSISIQIYGYQKLTPRNEELDEDSTAMSPSLGMFHSLVTYLESMPIDNSVVSAIEELQRVVLGRAGVHINRIGPGSIEMKTDS